ncbi:LiaF domain-containing protein [Dactylosporangium sp. NPDC000244]|uniref:LiaF domain-containing protein n=1 Tax=Dactylosporangium sp. NPDC000244 TaxID=3154365 RepID=UPI003317CB70
MDENETPFLTGKSGATWYFNLLGGTKRRGAWTMPQDMRVVGPLGGANLDLCEATLPPRPVLTKISLIGGVSLRVPADVEIEVEGFRIFGGVRIEPASEGAARRLKVREYSLIGGVHVVRG